MNLFSAKNIATSLCFSVGVLLNQVTFAQDFMSPESASFSDSALRKAGYVAKQENLRSFFEAISAQVGRPIIVSKLASRKHISGEFNLSATGTVMNRVARELGLVWYSDRYAIYVYDVSEMKNSVVHLRNTTVDALNQFLKKSGLADARYPLRTDGVDTFYISGPPIFVDLVARIAEFMDRQRIDQGTQQIGVIRLHNTFVSDRSYVRRDQNVVVPGIATVIENLLKGEGQSTLGVQKVAAQTEIMANVTELMGEGEEKSPSMPTSTKGKGGAAGGIKIASYPETNSLLVKGTAEQIKFIQNLVAALDEEKRHVELALWIIDLHKDDLDQLGAKWQGSVGIGDKLSASLNQGTDSFSAVDGMQFMASILALARKNKAQVVSRPIVLTQENTMAMFDNSRTIYTELIGERAVELQNVTYGTMVNVLPRFTHKDEIELSLNIEDGSEIAGSSGRLPTIGRSKISTVARVPKGKSLLIGGYTRGEATSEVGKIPGLGDLPWIGAAFRYRKTQNVNTVRVFLIQPREIREGIDLETGDLQKEMAFGSIIEELNQPNIMNSPRLSSSDGAFGGR